MYTLFRKILFRFSPEAVHHWVMSIMKIAYAIVPVRMLMCNSFVVKDKRLEKELWGIKFPNPVGLAAGFDKDARYTDALACLGFGFVEIGTVTPRPQPGNDKPRLFRLPKDKALINRMGFNNGGSSSAAERLRHRKEKLIIGGNIGKNKVTANEDALNDYIHAFKDLYDVADYFVVNVSSPNTPGLRELQDKAPLMAILKSLNQLNKDLGNPKPLLLKIAPDLTNSQLDDIIDIVCETSIQGIVATNTTIDRSGLTTSKQEVEQLGAGGLSGLPLKKRATEVIRYIHQKSNQTIPIIAAGGIFTAADAKEKLDAGASLVQVYTGFIYEGPAITKNICKVLLNH
jgi:dihydroorotate dehydrogenase